MKRFLDCRISLLILLLLTSASLAYSSEENSELDVVVLGDSNTWIGGDDCSKPRGWTYWFARKFPHKSLRSYARSGATWTNTANTVKDTENNIGVIGDQNVIYNQVERLIDAVNAGEQDSPEIVIIAAGTNDAWFSDMRPGLFSKTVDEVFSSSELSVDKSPSEVLTLLESVKYSVEKLAKRFPKAEIVILIPPQIKKCDYASQRKVRDLLLEAGLRLSVPVIDLHGAGGTNMTLETAEHTNTYDGVHFSEAGASRQGSYVASQLASILYF